MSYHENTDRNGRTLRRHYNGKRFTVDYEGLAMQIEMAEEANPDSRYWERSATERQLDLVDLIGEEAYQAWFEETWPTAGSHHTVDDHTWKQIYQAADAAVLSHKQSSTESVACLLLGEVERQ